MDSSRPQGPTPGPGAVRPQGFQGVVTTAALERLRGGKGQAGHLTGARPCRRALATSGRKGSQPQRPQRLRQRGPRYAAPELSFQTARSPGVLLLGQTGEDQKCALESGPWGRRAPHTVFPTPSLRHLPIIPSAYPRREPTW